jgi:pSer/pThr/pTyr-binding forkhead associated (FHA) protein
MAKLLLKFDSAVIREVPLGKNPITIGRAPDNDIQIDNLAVSDHHARISTEDTRLRIEDLDSLNGVSVNGTSTKSAWLSSGDNVSIGKHVIVIDLEHDVVLFEKSRSKVSTPKLDETYVMDSHPRSDPGQHPKSDEMSGESASNRARVPCVIVLKGKTTQKKYALSGKLTVIGKSSLATLQLRGWFAPHAAAQISKRQDGYYLSPVSRRATLINGRRVTNATRLNDGDLIEVAGVSLKFMYGD